MALEQHQIKLWNSIGLYSKLHDSHCELIRRRSRLTN